MTMEVWELIVRESIRDLVARYNACGDSGRFDELLTLFWDDATMEIASDDGPLVRRGHDEIGSIFTSTAERWRAGSDAAAGGHAPPRAHHVRHRVATLVIDVDDEHHARGYSYYSVVMPHGLDHWGRYFDRYEERDGQWRFAHRRVTREGARGSQP